MMREAAWTTAPPRPAGRGGFRRFWIAVRQVFHEVTGAVFAVMAFAWTNAAWRAAHRDVARWLVWTAVFVALMMLAFSVASFRSARRVR